MRICCVVVQGVCFLAPVVRVVARRRSHLLKRGSILNGGTMNYAVSCTRRKAQERVYPKYDEGCRVAVVLALISKRVISLSLVITTVLKPDVESAKGGGGGTAFDYHASCCYHEWLEVIWQFPTNYGSGSARYAARKDAWMHHGPARVVTSGMPTRNLVFFMHNADCRASRCLPLFWAVHGSEGTISVCD